MQRTFRQKLIAAVTFLGGLYFFLEFVLPPSIGGVEPFAYHEQISNGLVAIGAMAIGLGLINIFGVHGGRILFLRAGWGYSVALLLGFFLMVGVTTVDWLDSLRLSKQAERFFVLRDFSARIVEDAEKNSPNVLPLAQRNQVLVDTLRAELVSLPTVADAQDSDRGRSLLQDLSASRAELENTLASFEIATTTGNQSLGTAIGEVGSAWYELLAERQKVTTSKHLYDLLYTGLFTSLGAAMFSLLGFYIASAAYRAFRIRSAESALMMAAAALVMLGQIPFGLWIWDGFPEVRAWLLSTPSAAAFRAIKIGAAVAALVMAYRMWFSIESERFSAPDKGGNR